MPFKLRNPLKKVKGGGTKKVCLPAAKVRSMSASERAKVVRAKRTAAKGGKYKRSSKSFVKDYIETKEMSYTDKIKDMDLMIESFEKEERYEDCAFLVKIKNKIETHYINKLKKESL